jgi:hypothetical protein
MSDLTEFLSARVAEDEAVARKAAETHGTTTWDVSDGCVVPIPPPGNSYVAVGPWGGDVDNDQAAHIVRHDPARVLAECEAKRAIMVLHIYDWNPRGLCMADDEPGPCPTIRALAQPYADHPDYRDYRDEWHP